MPVTVPPYVPPLTLENMRGPTVNDGPALGYKVGDLWQYNGLVSQLQSAVAYNAVNNNGAAWTPVYTGGTPALDFVGTAKAAYSTRRLRGAYSGNCLDITRASDNTTLTIGFVNNLVDFATADSFIVGTTGVVTKWYDQSGNGYDATAVAATAPLWLTNTVNGKRCVTFGDLNTGTIIYRFMTIPSGCSFIPNVTNFFFAGIARSPTNANMFAGIGSAAGNAANPVYVVKNPSNASLGGMGINGAAGTQKVPILSSPAVTAFTIDPAAPGAGDAFYFSNNFTSPTHAFMGVTGATPVTGGVLGGISATWGFSSFDAVDMIFYSRSMTAVEITNVRAAMMAGLNCFPQVRSILVTDGDSITYGQGDSGFILNYPRLLFERLSYPVQIFNTGIPGILVGDAQTAGTLSTFFSNLAAAGIYNLAWKNFIVDLKAGTNDLEVGQVTSATLITRVANYIAQWHGLDSTHVGNIKVCYSGILARSGLTGIAAAQLAAFNAAIQSIWNQPLASGGLGADCFIDWSANAVMNAAGAPANTALFVDGLHPTYVGYGYLISQDAAGITNLLQGHL